MNIKHHNYQSIISHHLNFITLNVGDTEKHMLKNTAIIRIINAEHLAYSTTMPLPCEAQFGSVCK